MIESETLPIELVSPEIVAEIERLVDLMKLDEWRDKVLTAANISKFSEMSAEQAEKNLTRLNDKLKKGAE